MCWHMAIACWMSPDFARVSQYSMVAAGESGCRSRASLHRSSARVDSPSGSICCAC